MQPKLASDYVSVNYRYIAAYNEVNARITQRQHALSVYIALIVGLVAAPVASRQIEPANLPVEWIVCGFPIASICLVLLNYKYERTLTNLRQYLSELERLNNCLALPSYNTETRWAANANKARRFHDIACAVLVISCNGIALGLFYQMYPEQFKLTSPTVWPTSIVALASVGALLSLSRFSHRPRCY